MITEMTSTVIGRFTTNESTFLYRWLNQRYAWIWAQQDWPWKRVYGSLTITSGDETPTMPTDYGGRILTIWNTKGFELLYLEPQEWILGYSNTLTGKPEAWTIIDGVLYLGPTPNANETYPYLYEMHPKVKDSGGTVQDRIFASATSTDEPIWEEYYHHMLIPGALASGLKQANDPTWPDLEQQFMQEYSAMVEALLPPDRGENIQFEREVW